MPECFRGELLTMGRCTNLAFFTFFVCIVTHADDSRGSKAVDERRLCVIVCVRVVNVCS